MTMWRLQRERLPTFASVAHQSQGSTRERSREMRARRRSLISRPGPRPRSTAAGYPARRPTRRRSNQSAGRRHPVRARAAGDDGLRADRGAAGRAVPDPHPLHRRCRLPYHIGNGWFGGFLPTTAFAMVAATGNIYYGLWYPVVVAAVTLVVGLSVPAGDLPAAVVEQGCDRRSSTMSR